MGASFLSRFKPLNKSLRNLLMVIMLDFEKVEQKVDLEREMVTQRECCDCILSSRIVRHYLSQSAGGSMDSSVLTQPLTCY